MVALGAGGIFLLAALLAARHVSPRPTGATHEALLKRAVAAGADRRDDLLIELGQRGPQVIPSVLAAYRNAQADATLRMQLADAILRTGDAGKAAEAFETLLAEEKDPDVRRKLQGHLVTARQQQGRWPQPVAPTDAEGDVQ